MTVIVTYRFHCLLEAGLIIKMSGAQWALTRGVDFFQRLSKELLGALYCVHITERERERVVPKLKGKCPTVTHFMFCSMSCCSLPRASSYASSPWHTSDTSNWRAGVGVEEGEKREKRRSNVKQGGSITLDSDQITLTLRTANHKTANGHFIELNPPSKCACELAVCP